MYYLIPYQESVFLYVSKTLPSPNYLYLYCICVVGIPGLKESVQIGIIYERKPVRFMCNHCCLCRRRPIPSRLSNELFDWPIGKTESQSKIVFKGQLWSVLQTPHADYCTVQQFIGSAIDRQAHFNSEKYIILKFDSIKQKNTLYYRIKHPYNSVPKLIFFSFVLNIYLWGSPVRTHIPLMCVGHE